MLVRIYLKNKSKSTKENSSLVKGVQGDWGKSFISHPGSLNIKKVDMLVIYEKNINILCQKYFSENSAPLLGKISVGILDMIQK